MSFIDEHVPHDTLPRGSARWFRPVWAIPIAAVIGTFLVAMAVYPGTDGSEAPPPPTSDPTPKDERDIRRFLREPGDQVVVVPSGTYVAGEVEAAHPQTDGRYGGWLILVAERPGAVLVDMSPPGTELANGLVAGGDLTLAAGSSRIMFVGFRFVNGSVRVAGEQVTFWHTDHSYPAERWASEPHHPSGGDPPMYHQAPRTMYIDAGARDIQIRGSVFHDTGTALYVGNDVVGLTVEGVTIEDLDDGAQRLDPNDVIHPDGIAMIAGGVRDVSIRSSWIKVGRAPSTSGVVISDRQGPVEDLRLEDLWVSDTTGGGLNFFSASVDGLPLSGQGVFGEIDGVRLWDNGWNRGDTVDGVSSTRPNRTPDRIHVRHAAVDEGPPDAGAVDPARSWRRAHPYDQWDRHGPWLDEEKPLE